MSTTRLYTLKLSDNFIDLTLSTTNDPGMLLISLSDDMPSTSVELVLDAEDVEALIDFMTSYRS